MFITFEGCEASGKSTQSKILRSKLESMGYHVLLTKEPGGTELAENIRSILLDHEINDPLTELFMLSTARHDHILKIAKALRSGSIVISDRFADSSRVYQGYAKGLKTEIVEQLINLSTSFNYINNSSLNHAENIESDFHSGLRQYIKQNFANSIIEPDITILLDIEIETLKARIEASSIHQSFYDKKDIGFHIDIRNGFLDLQKRFPDRIRIIDGNKTADVVTKQIFDLLDSNTKLKMKN